MWNDGISDDGPEEQTCMRCRGLGTDAVGADCVDCEGMGSVILRY